MASKPRLPRKYRVGDRVVAHGWRFNLEWSREGTVLHSYQSAVDGFMVVVLLDHPEADGAAMFDLPTTDVEPALTSPPGAKL